MGNVEIGNFGYYMTYFLLIAIALVGFCLAIIVVVYPVDYLFLRPREMEAVRIKMRSDF